MFRHIRASYKFGLDSRFTSISRVGCITLQNDGTEHNALASLMGRRRSGSGLARESPFGVALKGNHRETTFLRDPNVENHPFALFVSLSPTTPTNNHGFESKQACKQACLFEEAKLEGKRAALPPSSPEFPCPMSAAWTHSEQVSFRLFSGIPVHGRSGSP